MWALHWVQGAVYKNFVSMSRLLPPKVRFACKYGWCERPCSHSHQRGVTLPSTTKCGVSFAVLSNLRTSGADHPVHDDHCASAFSDRATDVGEPVALNHATAGNGDFANHSGGSIRATVARPCRPMVRSETPCRIRGEGRLPRDDAPEARYGGGDRRAICLARAGRSGRYRSRCLGRSSRRCFSIGTSMVQGRAYGTVRRRRS